MARHHALRALGAMPLWFEPNQGLAPPDVDYVSRAPGYQLSVSGRGASLSRRPRQPAAGKPQPPALARSQRTGMTDLQIRFLGANPDPRGSGRDPLRARVNDYRGDAPSRWRTGIPTFARVQYEQVYAGIDLVYYGNPHQLEYDLVVTPGADPGAIRLEFTGADRVELDRSGDLRLHTAGGTILQRKPSVYQEIDGERRAIEGGYRFVSTTDHRPPTTGRSGSPAVVGGRRSVVAFELAAYDRTRPLVVDPVLAYSTLFDFENGSGERARHVSLAVDTFPDGRTAVTGEADGDAFVALFDPLAAGPDSLLFFTLLGGSPFDEGRGIAVQSDEIYVTGRTFGGFPLVNATQIFAGNEDVFVSKLDDEGVLLFSTYLGGQEADEGNGIAVRGDRIYVTGVAGSRDFPTTRNAFRTLKRDGLDAFVTRLDLNGSNVAELEYSSFVGGNGDDIARGIAIIQDQELAIVGETTSTNFPVTQPFCPNCLFFQDDQPGKDAFVAMLDLSEEGFRSFSGGTYLGGSGTDIGFGIAVDRFRGIFVTGITGSVNFPHPGFPGIQGPNDGFVAKFEGNTVELDFSRFLGGTGREEARAIALDEEDNTFWVTGKTDSLDFPTVTSVQGTIGLPAGSGAAPPFDAFVTGFDPAAGILFSTYLGGSEFDQGNGISRDLPGEQIVVTGHTFSPNFPLVNAADTVLHSPDGFLARIDDVGRDRTFRPGLGGFWVDLAQHCSRQGQRGRCTLRGTFYLQSQGGGPFPPSVLRFFLSTDAALSADDILVEEQAVGGWASGRRSRSDFRRDGARTPLESS